MTDDVLSMVGLRVETHSGAAIVEDVTLHLRPGEVLGLVGESGSGKTTTALAAMGYQQRGTRITDGRIAAAGEVLRVGDEPSVRPKRGRLISYVPQNPGSALSPSVRVGAALKQMLEAHVPGNHEDAEVAARFAKVGLPQDESFLRRFPHQLSGGQQQRVCIAIAVACEPAVVVLDEPTTGLDVTTQARILDELARLRQEHGVAMLYVTHNLAVIARIADRVAVMYSGRIVEEGPTASILRHPRHPYTRGLLASIPDHVHPVTLEPMAGVAPSIDDRPSGCAFGPRCRLHVDKCSARVPSMLPVGDSRTARCIRWAEVERHEGAPVVRDARQPDVESELLAVSELSAQYRVRGRSEQVVSDVSFSLQRAQCLALVGESGSGKTTIARVIAGLHSEREGSVRLLGQPLAASARRRTVDQRRRVQFIFQNPALALNPRQTVGESVGRPARLLRGLSGREADSEVVTNLDRVRLTQRYADRYPAELSGGEQQRVAIARALIAEPDLLVCDEVTSALDVSVQGVVLELLRDLRGSLGLSLLFITHDLGVVGEIADRIIMLADGVICEHGTAAQVLKAPESAYAKELLAAAPSISNALQGPREHLVPARGWERT